MPKTEEDKFKTPRNIPIYVNMQPQAVEMLDHLVEHFGCSTRAEMIRILIREQATQQGLLSPIAKMQKRKRKRKAK